MMEVVKNNVQNLDFQQKQIMMMGGMVQKNQKKLSDAEIKKLKSDYVAMYYGFVSINWGNGKTLGVSWQKALEQMDGYIMSKAKIANHPVNSELIKFHREFRKDTAKTIMTNPYTEEKLSERLRQDFVEYGTKCAKEAKKSLDDVYQKYMPEKPIRQDTTAKKFDIASQNMQKILQMWQAQELQNQRAA